VIHSVWPRTVSHSRAFLLSVYSSLSPRTHTHTLTKEEEGFAMVLSLGTHRGYIFCSALTASTFSLTQPQQFIHVLWITWPPLSRPLTPLLTPTTNTLATCTSCSARPGQHSTHAATTDHRFTRLNSPANRWLQDWFTQGCHAPLLRTRPLHTTLLLHTVSWHHALHTGRHTRPARHLASCTHKCSFTCLQVPRN
jgi:hypothetical protein